MIAQSIFASKRFWAMVAILCLAIWFNRSESLTFSLSRISPELSYHPEWDVRPPSHDIDKIFSQDFHYLDSGAQSYAFESADGKYVLKFFKTKHRIKNPQKLFHACKLAYEDMPNETGVVFLHLNPTEHLHRTITISDRLRRLYTVDLDQYAFLVQEKAELIFTRMKRLRKEGDIAGVIQAKEAVCAMVKNRIAKGFADEDQAVSHNYGFVGDRPIQIDIGRLYKGTKKGEYEHIRARIERWMQESGITTGATSSAVR